MLLLEIIDIYLMFEWSTMILQKKKNNNNKINLIHNFKKNANIFKWIKKNM